MRVLGTSNTSAGRWTESDLLPECMLVPDSKMVIRQPPPRKPRKKTKHDRKHDALVKADAMGAECGDNSARWPLGFGSQFVEEVYFKECQRKHDEWQRIQQALQEQEAAARRESWK